MSSGRVVVLCCLLLAAPHAVVAGRAEIERQSRIVPLPPSRSLQVDVTLGEVALLGSDRPDAEIEVVRHAPSTTALARLPLEILEDESSVRVRVVQPGGATDPSLRATVTIRLPRAAHVRATRIAEGRLRLAGLAGAITAEVSRGPIDGSDLEGTLRLETGIGDVTLDRTRLTPGGLIRLRAFNGQVRLTLAERPRSARVLALALNGTIESDIPLQLRDTWGPRWGEATIGDGEPVISLDVVTGRIVIKSPS